MLKHPTNHLDQNRQQIELLYPNLWVLFGCLINKIVLHN